MPQFADPFARPSIAHLSLGRTSGELDLARHLAQLDDGRPHPFCRRCLDGPFGIVVLVAADELDARALVEADPSVAAGVQQAELYPFSIFLPAVSRGAPALPR